MQSFVLTIVPVREIMVQARQPRPWSCHHCVSRKAMALSVAAALRKHSTGVAQRVCLLYTLDSAAKAEAATNKGISARGL